MHRCIPCLNICPTEEIPVSDSAISETFSVVGAKSIAKNKNTIIPEGIKDEPGITISRRAGIGDTKDIVSIRGLLQEQKQNPNSRTQPYSITMEQKNV